MEWERERKTADLTGKMGIGGEEDLKCDKGETARKKQTRESDRKSERVR